MRLIRTFGTIIGRAIKSKFFLMAFFMVFAFRLLDIFGAFADFITKVDGKYVVLAHNIMDIFEIFGVTMLGMIMLVIPVITYSGAFCDDLSSNYLTYVLMKSGKPGYCVATVTACAISSFLCVFLGELAVIILLGQFMPFYDERYASFPYAFTIVFTRLLLFGLQGAFYGVVTMLMSVFAKSKFVIYTSPLLLYFFFAYLGSNILKISTKINPALVFNYYALGAGKEVESVIYALVYLIFVMFIVVKVMEKKIERCY